jgi:hypothetical protein
MLLRSGLDSGFYSKEEPRTRPLILRAVQAFGQLPAIFKEVEACLISLAALV